MDRGQDNGGSGQTKTTINNPVIVFACFCFGAAAVDDDEAMVKCLSCSLSLPVLVVSSLGFITLDGHAFLSCRVDCVVLCCLVLYCVECKKRLMIY